MMGQYKCFYRFIKQIHIYVDILLRKVTAHIVFIDKFYEDKTIANNRREIIERK